MAKITNAHLSMLARIATMTDRTGGLLALTITSESRAAARKLQDLMIAGLAETCPHPTIKAEGNAPARAVRITAAGRGALA